MMAEKIQSTINNTIEEVLRIQEEGQTRRRQAESELVKIENELKQKLIESVSAGKGEN